MHKFEFFYVISQSETRNNKKKVIFIMDLTGRIIAVLQPRSGVSARTGNTWMTQEYVMEVPGQYPRHMVFNIFGEDRIKQFNIQMNQDYTVSFDIDAHEYNGRWFNDVRAWKVDRIDPAAAQAAAQGAQPFPAPDTTAAPAAPEEVFSSGSLKLKNCDEKPAAMIMAIVADDSGIPLEELVFKSIKLVEKD